MISNSNSTRPSTASPQQQMPQQYNLLTFAEAVGAIDMLSSTRNTNSKSPSNTNSNSSLQKEQTEPFDRNSAAGLSRRVGCRDGSSTFKVTKMAKTKGIRSSTAAASTSGQGVYGKGRGNTPKATKEAKTKGKRSTAAASGSRRGGHEGCRRQGGHGGREGGRDSSNTLKATMTPKRNVATLPREAQYQHWGNIGYHDYGDPNHITHTTYTLWTSFDQSRQPGQKPHQCINYHSIHIQ